MKRASVVLLCLVSCSASGFDTNADYKPGTIIRDRNWAIQKGARPFTVEARRFTSGSRKIVVAVIDTGIDPTHRDLAKNIWHDPKNPSVFGWNFVTNQSNPYDDHGHGTHVAGVITAVADVSIMALKYYSDSNPGATNLANLVKALNYAVEHGAHIINISGGGPQFSREEYLAIKRAEANGVVVVAAAGNEHQSTDKTQNYYYPASYDIPNIISVAATSFVDQLVPSSNWGGRVSVAAPGENLFSALPGGRYGTMTGTSQATSYVSGVVALLKSCDNSLTPTQIRGAIIRHSDKLPELEFMLSGGRINAYKALRSVLKKNRCPN